jgi:hypothetical protein
MEKKNNVKKRVGEKEQKHSGSMESKIRVASNNVLAGAGGRKEKRERRGRKVCAEVSISYRSTIIQGVVSAGIREEKSEINNQIFVDVVGEKEER